LKELRRIGKEEKANFIRMNPLWELNQENQDILKKEKSILNELFYGTSGKNLNEALSHLDSILTKIDGGDGTLGSFVNDPTVYEDVKSVLGGAKRSSIMKYFMRQFIETSEKEKEKEKEDSEKENIKKK
jgi:phospholipid/cholesterol/gamma-HCH transport system substrate-binding protein